MDQEGNVVSISKSLCEFLSLDQKSNHSIFKLNAEMSFMKWQELIKRKSNKIETQDTVLLTADSKPVPIEVSSINIEIGSQTYCYYAPLIPKKNIGLESNSQKTINKDLYSYDAYAPNAVFYFSPEGNITYQNNIAKNLKREITQVQDLFLEPEIGPLPNCLEPLDREKEHIIRMIMKSDKGFKEGYSRVSIYDDNPETRRYRLEFLMSDGMSLMDRPLEEAMVEIDRLTEVISNKKEILIDDSMQDFSFDSIVTQSAKYKKVLSQIAQVADTTSTVLITGETGTGKEMLCNLIYKLSDRAEELIVKVNCATIPENLIESILFGHEKGAFTDAKEKKIGKFELANGGTIFLDEIGEMPYDMQAKLLRVLQEGEIERIGNPEAIKVDVRVIAATNRDLESLIKEKKFRADLYYRLNVFPIYNIPLRERKEDISPLMQHFIVKSNKKTGRNVTKVLETDVKLLEAYDFPGNVRELENIVERGVISANDDTLNLNFFLSNKGLSSEKKKSFQTLIEMEKNHIIEALRIRKGKVTGKDSASELLDINGKTLVSRIKKLGINPKLYTD